MSNVTKLRHHDGGADHPWTHEGWMWNGTQWVPTPPFPPMCPPPPCPPPSCFSHVAKADACWDQSKELYEFLTKVISDIFRCNPGLIPPPPPGTGTGPIIGVTDGSVAAPGEVGEVLCGSAVGTIPAGTLNSIVAPLTLTPGDWDVQYFMWALTPDSAQNLSAITFELSGTGIMPTNGTPVEDPEAGGGTLGSFSTDAVGSYINEITFASSTYQYSIAAPGLLAVACGLNANSPAIQYAVTAFARRRR